MKCEWCETEFFPAKPWQRFHSQKCHDDWHNRERLRRQIEAADARRVQRINGHNEVDLVALGLVAKPVAVKRRKISAGEQQQSEQR